jgi:DNA-binding NarL/FixJ family response regulator
MAELRAAVVLMDIAMPLLNGLEATRQILKVFPETKVLILSAHGDDAHVRHAAEAGAAGFLVKQTSAREVCRAVREIRDGKALWRPAPSDGLFCLHPPLHHPVGLQTKKAAALTSREMEVLQLIAESKSNKETALELGVGIKTIEKHRTHLMRKLNIHDTAGLTRYAISAGVIESGIPLTLV